MADSKHRERAMLKGEDKPVTIIKGRIGDKQGKTTIRTAFGFVKDVPSKDLSHVPDSSADLAGFDYQTPGALPTD